MLGLMHLRLSGKLVLKHLPVTAPSHRAHTGSTEDHSLLARPMVLGWMALNLPLRPTLLSLLYNTV